jgi:hypothetical protein
MRWRGARRERLARRIEGRHFDRNPWLQGLKPLFTADADGGAEAPPFRTPPFRVLWLRIGKVQRVLSRAARRRGW